MGHLETAPRLAIGTDKIERISQLLHDETHEIPEDGMIDPMFKIQPLGGAIWTFVAADGKEKEVPELHQILSPIQRKEQSDRACRSLFESTPDLIRRRPWNEPVISWNVCQAVRHQ
jgi:hypothetical protein